MSVVLGAYRLGSRLGRGGMGEVWQAVHTPTSRPVAVKLLRDTQPAFLRGVRIEARAIAALDHPHVVALLDLGVVGDDAGPGLAARSPYLVMELVEGGDLKRWLPRLAWPELRRLADDLLDALAHAHARGVIHRDVKPGNVLRARDGAARPGWRLTDFGLAHGRYDAQASVREGARGSPRYMAPEQFTGWRRDLGPWTDLYGLACLLWEAVTGVHVFDGDTLDDVREGHLSQPPPDFRPRMQVPDGLEDWLRACLAKRTVDRFACAADAADALRRLDRGSSGSRTPARPPVSGPAIGPTPSDSGGASPTFVEVEVDPDTTSSTELLHRPVEASIPAAVRPRRPSAAPHPHGWRHDAEPAPRAPLASASLALVLLRQPPFVGRTEVRDRLWEHLGQVHRSGMPRTLVLTGAPGLGETRLARWLVHRARETGSAHALLVHHGPLGEGGLAELVADALHLHGLKRRACADRLEHLIRIGLLPPDTDAEALLDTVVPADGALPIARRRAAVLALLHTLTLDRPLVLVLDDAHRSEEARTWIELLAGQELPILTVATGQPPAAAGSDRPGAEALLELAARIGAEVAALGPLDPVARRELVRRIVDLDDALAQRLEAHSRGHPQLLVEALLQWVRQGDLQAGPRGFRLAPGAHVGLPGSLEEVLAEQLDRACADRTDFEARAIEVAAVLGDSVHVRTWAATCLMAGATVGEDLVSHLVETGIWRREEEQGGGLRFASSLMRNLVLDRARTAGRLPSHHRAAARRITRDGGRSERLGLHRLRAGDAAGAVDPLLHAAEDELLARDIVEAARIAGWLQEALDALPSSVRPQARARAHLVHATLHVLRGAGPDAQEDLDAAEGLARAHRWTDLRARVDLLRARRAIRQRRFGEALGHLKHASERASQVRDRRLQGRAHLQRGSLLLYLGRLAEAEVELAVARPLARSHPADLAKVLMTQARAATQRGDRAQARMLLGQARPWFQAAGSAWGPIAVQDHLARLDRLEGHLDRAAAGYRAVYRGYLALGLRQAEVALLHGALVDLERGLTDRARPTFTHAVAAFRAQRAPVLEMLAWAGRLATDAASGDAGAFDEALQGLTGSLASGAVVHDELGPVLERACTHAAERLGPRHASAVDALRIQHRSLLAAALPDTAMVGITDDELTTGALEGDDVFALSEAEAPIRSDG